MNTYGGFPNVDELRTAYERLQERMHAKCDEVERLRAALEHIRELGHTSHHGRGFTLARLAEEALS